MQTTFMSYKATLLEYLEQQLFLCHKLVPNSGVPSAVSTLSLKWTLKGAAYAALFSTNILAVSGFRIVQDQSSYRRGLLHCSGRTGHEGLNGQLTRATHRRFQQSLKRELTM